MLDNMRGSGRWAILDLVSGNDGSEALELRPASTDSSKMIFDTFS